MDWYDFIVNNHFKERNLPLPHFLTREFVAFKLPGTNQHPKTKHEHKIFNTKQHIQTNIHTMPTSQLIYLICDTSFTHFSRI